MYCRDTGELIEWELGNRDSATFTKLYKRLTQSWQIKHIFTDKFKVYEEVITDVPLTQTKKETHNIESNNAMQRNWFRRFTRKASAISRSMKMIEHTMSIFARFRVNGNPEDILSEI